MNKISQIHTIIEDKDLPECLKRKAVFGDREQIDALRSLESISEKALKRKVDIESGNLKKFYVHLGYSADYTVEVWACSQNEAESIASDESEEPDDWELSLWAREAKEDKKDNK